MMLIQKYDVYEAALSRIRYLFDEFEHVLVSMSGGKDSTTILQLALQVAREKGRLPLKVMFLDQEAEWRHNIEYIREIFSSPEIDPQWLQIPFKIFNATSASDEWLYCWEEGGDWMRPKEEYAITENVYGTDRFVNMFGAFLRYHYPDSRAIFLTGVRAQEAQTRRLGLTQQKTYKHITYGKLLDKKRGHFNFHPLYDWNYTDVWKYIHDNDFEYCKIYDFMFQKGVPVHEMRISNLNHETALLSLFLIQEFEPDTWEALTKRMSGINTFSQMKKTSMRCPSELPRMFSGWKVYRDYLLENLIEAEKQEIFQKKFLDMDKKYAGMHHIKDMYRSQISAIIVNDYHMTKIGNWERKIEVALWRRWKHQNIQPKSKSKYIHG